MDDILGEIKEERLRQNLKWGEQNHSVIEWQAILMEEVGEAAMQAVDFHFKNPVLNFTGIPIPPSERNQQHRKNEYRKELIQVAAVAIQMIECLDRNGK